MTSSEEPEEVPLLEDLDINLEEIKGNLKSVLFFRQFEEQFVRELDLIGPLGIYLLLAFSQTLVRAADQRRKLVFSYIYGFSTIGTFLIYLLVNLVIRQKYFSLYHTMSSLGYALAPIVVLSLVSTCVHLEYASLTSNKLGLLVGLVFILWSAATATKLIDTAVKVENQRWLIAYPILLFYTTFSILVIF